MSSGVFAIVGVVLGSVLTYLMQSRLARRTEEFARAQSLRHERLEVYSALAAQAMEARRAQINRWYQRRDSGRGTTQYADARPSRITRGLQLDSSGIGCSWSLQTST
jgi:hypothetical protein